jgi:hypothetical protein
MFLLSNIIKINVVSSVFGSVESVNIRINRLKRINFKCFCVHYIPFMKLKLN